MFDDLTLIGVSDSLISKAISSQQSKQREIFRIIDTWNFGKLSKEEALTKLNKIILEER